jgi:OmpA-OmpF porin, OOP family
MKIFLLYTRQMATYKTNAMKITGRCFLLLTAWLCCTQSQAQQAKNPVQLGDKYFAAGEYYTAANLYGQYLKPSNNEPSTNNFPLNVKGRRSIVLTRGVSRMDILFKQAESYRLANYWEEAAKAYQECAEKDPAQYADALYWHAVCKRSLGDYAAAQESLTKYLSNANASRLEDAGREMQTLKYIQQQLARPDSILVKTRKLDAPNSFEKGVFAPSHIKGNQFLFSSTQTDSVKVTGVNPHHSRLFIATLGNGSIDEMTALDIAGEPLVNQGAATISTDGKFLYFSQWKKENGHTSSSIYYAIKEGNGWSTPTLLNAINTAGSNSKQPFCSADGKYLFFSSDRAGGSGGFDIWYAPLKNDGSTGEPVNAGSTINTPGDEQAPYYQNSGAALVFSSNGRHGMGGYDLYSAKGNETSWKQVENLGHPVNSSRDDIYFYAPENSALLSNAIFSSDRGNGCCLETYNIVKTSKSQELYGMLIDCNEKTPVADAEVVLKDAEGKVWKTTTDAGGKYLIGLGNEDHKNLTLTVSKDQYKETISNFKSETVDESDLLISKLINSDICIEKMPEPAPEPVLVIKAENVVTVYFDFDKSKLGTIATDKMDSIYTVMAENPTATIQISGYTDGLGSEVYNKKLSDKRARACADYLMKKGIARDRISFVSFGACCPVEMELINGRDNPDGRSLNRRALINIKKD